MPTRVINPDGGGHFVVNRYGALNIELTGVHLACVEEFTIDSDGEWGERVDNRISLYRTSSGKYVLAYSGDSRNDWGTVHDSPEDVTNALFDRNDFLGELEKLLLREAALRDAQIAPFSRVDLRSDDIRELALSVASASQNVDVSTLYEHLRRIEQNLETDPGQAIGSAKELLETVASQILDHFGQNAQQTPDMPKLMSSAFSELLSKVVDQVRA